MKNKKEKASISFDAETYERMKEHLYSRKPVLGEESPFSELLQEMVNTLLDGEMSAHLKSDAKVGKRNKRNGHNHKKVISNTGMLDISTPRDRNGSFSPELIGKRERQLSSGLDEQILALYAQGNSVEDVRRLLSKMYGVDISSGKISQITDQVLPQIQEWRTRRLRPFYTILYLDAVHFKVRHEGRYSNRAFYTAYAVDWEGNRDLLGIYIQSSEGASRWGLVLEDIKERGVEDILVVCTDDLTGFSEVITEVYPKAIVQKCIVHQMRSSLKYVDEKDRKQVSKDLRKIYSSTTLEAANTAFESFIMKWGNKYDYIVKQWQGKWDELTAFFSFSGDIRRMIYTTNPVEALHRIVRKLIKSKAAWVSDTALVKQVFLSLMHNEKSWRRRAYGWKSIQRTIMETYPERVKPWI
jgi:transposase-like protein